MLYILTYLFRFITVCESRNNFIRNSQLPLCINCKHFQPSYYTMNNEIQRNNIDKCGKFGEINIISGEIIYDYADFCRKDENQCGENAKYFEPVSNISSTLSTIDKDW